MDDLDRRIINQFQGDIPVSDRPFADIAKQLNSSESEIMTRISFMLDDGLLTRFGPLYNIDKMKGVYSLCAMQVPENKFDSIADKINLFPEVAHNYQREHRLNMWFVLAAKSESALDQLIQDIKAATGFDVFSFPKQREFYVNLKLDI